MPLLLTDRAMIISPVELFTAREGEVTGLRLRSAEFLRVRPGVYARRAAFLRLSRWGRYAARAHAFVRTHPDAILSHESAAVVHGLPLFGETRFIHTYAAGSPTTHVRGDVRLHASVDPRDHSMIGHVRVTSLVETVVDLVRVLPPAQALAVVDAALSPVQGGGRHPLDEYRNRCSQRENPRGIATARWVWDNADRSSESPTESVSRAVIGWCGFETPELQREFNYEGARDRADFHFPSGRVIGEADGWGKYELDDPGTAAHRLKDEKRREDRLRRHGHPVVRWETRDAWRVTPLCDRLLAAGVKRERPASAAFLSTLRDRSRRAF